MPHDKDFADEDNIFSDDYMTDRLFEEEDEELGIDVHEIGLGEPKKAAYVREEYKKHGTIEGTDDVLNKSLTFLALDDSAIKKGVITSIAKTTHGIIIKSIVPYKTAADAKKYIKYYLAKAGTNVKLGFLPDSYIDKGYISYLEVHKNSAKLFKLPEIHHSHGKRIIIR